MSSRLLNSHQITNSHVAGHHPARADDQDDDRTELPRKLLARHHKRHHPRDRDATLPDFPIDGVEPFRLVWLAGISLDQLDAGDVLLDHDVQVGHPLHHGAKHRHQPLHTPLVIDDYRRDEQGHNGERQVNSGQRDEMKRDHHPGRRQP